MVRRFGRLVVAIVLATFGMAVVGASPAAAVGGCATYGNFIRPCFDYSGGTNARADFYVLTAPDNSRYSYRLALVINGVTHVKVNTKTRFGSTGRKCCWYQAVDNLPDRAQRGFTRVWVYRSDGVLHLTADSPTVSFVA